MPLFRVPFTMAIVHLFMSLLKTSLCFLVRLQTMCGQETSVSAHHCMPLSSPGLGNSGLSVCLWDSWIYGTSGWLAGFYCSSPVTDLTQMSSNTSWFVSRFHGLPPIASSLLILSSLQGFFLKDYPQHVVPLPLPSLAISTLSSPNPFLALAFSA